MLLAKACHVLCTLSLVAVTVALSPLGAKATPPSVVGRFVDNLMGRPQDFHTRGTLGCLVTKRGRGPEFYVLDLRDPGSPNVLGSLDFSGQVNRVVLKGDFAYLATGLTDSELVVVDLSTPAVPRVIGRYDAGPGRDAVSLAVRDSTIFLGRKRASGVAQHELYAIDVANPAAPTLLGSIDVDADVNDLALENDLLYVATSDNERELIVFDVATPSAITEVDSTDLPGSADAVTIP